ncbi:MAG: hypothetical protein AAFX92_03885 [Pseudomonadota bacterium]
MGASSVPQPEFVVKPAVGWAVGLRSNGRAFVGFESKDEPGVVYEITPGAAEDLSAAVSCLVEALRTLDVDG